MEQERKNHNILLTVIAVLTLLVAVIGATFAYFSATYTATKQSITTGELKINATSSIAHNTNIKPTDWDGEDQADITAENENENDIAVVTLTVDTTGTTIDSASYNIFLDASGIKLNAEQVKINQAGDTAALNGGKLSDVQWALFDDENKLGEGDFGSGVSDEGKVTDLQVNNTIQNIVITPNDKTAHAYRLYIWIQDDDNPQNKLQNLTIDATLKVEAKQDTIAG